MLTLTRQTGQSIHIGNEIIIHVSDISGGQAKISIEAPKKIKILRSELLANQRSVEANSNEST